MYNEADFCDDIAEQLHYERSCKEVSAIDDDDGDDDAATTVAWLVR